MNQTASKGKDLAVLKDYAKFIYVHHLSEASAEYINFAREVKLPLLKRQIVLTEEEIESFLKENFKSFLYQTFSGEVLITAEETMRKWKANELPGIPKTGVKVADIVLAYSARKQVLLNFLIRYSKDPETIVEVVRELEGLHAHLEEMAFATYLEIQQEEQQALNSKLKEYQEELQASNEELRESYEKLLVSNEELSEQAEKKAAIEKHLEKEHNYLKAVLENVSDGIVACNEEGVLSFFNDATRRFHGLPEKALPADDWATYYDLYYPDGKTPLKKDDIPLFKAYRGEKVVNQEMVIAPLNGKKRLLLATGRQIISSDGKNLGAVVVMHDITEQKEAEREIYESNKELAQALEELQSAEEQLIETNNELEQRVKERTGELLASEEELRKTLENALKLSKTIEEREHFLSSILDQTPVSTWIANAEGTQIRVNEACLKLFNVTDPESGLGKYNILKDESLTEKPFFKDIQAVFSEGKIATFETEYNVGHVKHVNIPDGRTVVVVATIFPIKNPEGRVTHAVIQHEDVTQRKQAEKALKESELLFRTIANASPVTLWMSGKEGGISYINQTWLDWTGRCFEDHLEQGWSYSIVTEDREEVIAKYLHNFQTRQYYKADFRIRHQNGLTRWCVAEGVPRYLANGEFAGYVGSCIDITERKMAEKALKEKNAELKKINADLDNFVYTASHDLKSPISNIEGLTLLLEKKLKERIENPEQKILEMIGQSVSRFKRTIGDLTEIAKVQKNLEFEMEEISFKEVLEDVKDDIQEMIVQSGASIREELTVETITYARHNLRSILYNLLSNAIKYSSPARPVQIDVNTYPEGKDIVLSVKDNGLGISENNLPKLFTMFKRLHSHVEGTGIGLYMIKRIVENKGGRIEVESKLNHGTCFRVYFSSTPK